VAVPDSILNSSGAVVVTGKRFFVRAPNGHYVETVGYIDLTGDALEAGKDDVAHYNLEAQTEITKLRAELEEAHRLLSAYVGNVEADAKAIDADANSFVNHVERFFGFGKTVAPVAATTPAPVAK
jgi:hypothetical protein